MNRGTRGLPEGMYLLWDGEYCGPQKWNGQPRLGPGRGPVTYRAVQSSPVAEVT